MRLVKFFGGFGVFLVLSLKFFRPTSPRQHHSLGWADRLDLKIRRSVYGHVIIQYLQDVIG